MAHELRVKVSNPGPRGGSVRKGKTMAKKRKKARSKKANPTKRKHTRKRKKNPAALAAPKRRTSRKRHRKSNPAKRRHFRARRASRRNPSGPMVQVGLAALAGLGAFVAANLVNIAANSSFDPMVRRGIAAAGVVGGLALASKKPVIGAGVAAASAVMLGGSELAMKAAELMPKKNVGAIVSMGAPYTLGPGDEAMGAPAMLLPGAEMGAVVTDMGAIAPDAPWSFVSPV